MAKKLVILPKKEITVTHNYNEPIVVLPINNNNDSINTGSGGNIRNKRFKKESKVKPVFQKKSLKKVKKKKWFE